MKAVAARLQCTKKETLKKAMRHLMSDDVGEGVILRLPKSAYIHGRSDVLIKLKAARGDAEALIVDSNDTALSIKLPNGTIMEVKKEQVKFGLDPKKGDIVTYEFERISRREIPVNIKIDRIRHDTSWEAVLHDFHLEQEKKEQRASTLEKSYSEKPARYWTTQQGLNSRKFLENFAKNKGFNPLVPENWYSIRKKDFPRRKGLIDTIKGGYVKALLYLFPDIGLKENKFVSVQKLIWKDVRNRRKFFDTVAKVNQFDPLISSNWYSLSLSKIYNFKNGQDVMKYYQGDLGKALIHVYPDVNLQLSNFDSSAKVGIKAKQRQFFVSIASDLKFDPLVANNWYSISKSTILNYKGALTVLSYYGHSFRKALVDLFPDVTFDSTKFLLWNDPNDRRRFFDRIAKELNFNPLVPENWGKIKRDTILSYKGGETVLSYHNNSYKTALRELYPEVNFSEDSLLKRFQTTTARQEFFMEFARTRGFDPFSAHSWVQITKNDITSYKGGDEILSFYDNNHRRAILQLFPNIGLENSRNFMWGNSKDRREFLDKFAKETKGFDPLIAENWYGVNYNEISSLPGGQQVLSFHNNNLAKALSDLYPNIGIHKSNFGPNWESSNLRRNFFDEIARDRNFDPLVLSNWFNISVSEILKYPDAQKVLSYHGNNQKRALEELYPFMEGFEEKEKLSHRLFFDEFSASRNFDPLFCVNWYSIVRDEIFAKQGGKEILQQYANSLKNAIPEIYPNINFDKTKFNQWENKEIRKLFLDKISREIKMDPLVLENWRNLPEDKLKSFTGAQRVLAYHGKNILKAVKDLYPDIKM